MTELKCCDCGGRVGFFDANRLPRALRASLGALAGTFSGGDDEGKPLPIVCVPCSEKAK